MTDVDNYSKRTMKKDNYTIMITVLAPTLTDDNTVYVAVISSAALYTGAL